MITVARLNKPFTKKGYGIDVLFYSGLHESFFLDNFIAVKRTYPRRGVYVHPASFYYKTVVEKDEKVLDYLNKYNLRLDEKGKWLMKKVQESIEGSRLVKLDEREEESVRALVRKQSPYLASTLKPFQLVSVKAGIEKLTKSGVFYLGDPMGSGKTLQAISIALALRTLKKEKTTTLIFCPHAVVPVWEAELKRIGVEESEVKVLDSTALNKGVKATNESFVIVPYSVTSFKKTQKKLNEALKSVVPDVVILDEAHNLKKTSNRSVYVKTLLAKYEPYTVALSGTIQTKTALDVMYQADVIGALYQLILVEDKKGAIANTYKRFKEWFVEEEERYLQGLDLTVKNAVASKNVELLNVLLKGTFYLGRVKEDVLPFLPEKTVKKLDVEISKDYKKAYSSLMDLILQEGMISVKGEGDERRVENYYMRLLQTISLGKVKSVVELALHLIENEEEKNKVVVFAHFKDTQKKIYDALCKELGEESVLWIKEGMKKQDVQEVVNRFNEDESVCAVVVSLQVGKEGINLIGGNQMIFADVPLLSSDKAQAEDRIHRIGQKRNVTIYYVTAKGTIEQKIFNVLQRRVKEFESITSYKALLKAFFAKELESKGKDLRDVNEGVNELEQLKPKS